jgi:23S rRNA pseudouridine1911/1915/1917 synthase
MPSWIVDLPDRLDAFLAAEGRMLSRAKAQKAIEEKKVKVNDARVTKPAQRLQEGDKVELLTDELSDEEASVIAPVDLHLSVLYEDAACMVINKPAGVSVHPGAGMAPDEVTLLSGIAFLFNDRSLPFSADSVLVHRLDKDTTGCLLVAKTPAAHLFLQNQFETRTVRKSYLALVAGVPKVAEATIDSPIGRSPSDRTQMTVFSSSKARDAQTTYRVLDAGKNVALLECDLHTGRTHQVRVHLSSIGHPILGDGTYVNQLSERMSQEFGITSLCLHAWKLAFTSPADKKEHAVNAILPAQFLRSLEATGIVWKP